MNLELSLEEAALLREFLDQRLGDMSAEISHTDNPAFRRELKARRDHMRAVRDRLAGAAA